LSPEFTSAAEGDYLPMTKAPYAGDVTPEAAWKALKNNSKAVLVDVRTVAEWNFVGIPDLEPIGRKPVTIEWQFFPSGSPNPAFQPSLERTLEALGADRDAPVYFLCRSGGRSAAAAAAMTRAGFSQCFNVTGGFEGPRDESGHRGTIEGWKASGLPWSQP